MKRCLGVLMLSFLICFMSGISLAQQEEETEYSWGIVTNVSSDSITVREYDYDNDEEVDVTYVIDPDVELKNVDSLQDIAVDDGVDIEYVVKGSEKVAKIIAVEEMSETVGIEEEEYTEEME